jgi:hypothetical protein
MHLGKLVLAQLIEHLSLHTFRRCVAKYPSRYPTLTFSHLDQVSCMAFAHLMFRESLRDIDARECTHFRVRQPSLGERRRDRGQRAGRAPRALFSRAADSEILARHASHSAQLLNVHFFRPKRSSNSRTSTSMRYESAFICRTRRPIDASSSSMLRSSVDVWKSVAEPDITALMDGRPVWCFWILRIISSYLQGFRATFAKRIKQN